MLDVIAEDVSAAEVTSRMAVVYSLGQAQMTLSGIYEVVAILGELGRTSSMLCLRNLGAINSAGSIRLEGRSHALWFAMQSR